MKTDGNEPIAAGRIKVTRVFQGSACTSHEDFVGLTKREHFVSMALQGFLSNGTLGEKLVNYSETDKKIMQILTRASCDVADALIAALNEKAGIAGAE